MVTKILGHLVELLTQPPTTSCYQDHSAPKTQKQREVKTFYSNKIKTTGAACGEAAERIYCV